MVHLNVARLLATALLLTGSATAQGRVWVVTTPFGLQSAITAASDGDMILLKGNWSSEAEMLVAAKSLTVLQDRGSSVFIESATVRDLAAGQHVELRGLTLLPRADLIGQRTSPALTLSNNQGSVWIEGCEAVGLRSGPDSAPGVLVDHSSNVVLLEMKVRGSDCTSASGVCAGLNRNAGHALVLRGGSRVVAHGCEFQGGDGYWCSETVNPVPGAAGIQSEAPEDRLFLSGCQALGGRGHRHSEGGPVDSCSPGGPGLFSAGFSRVLDSLTQGGPGAAFMCSPAGADQVGQVRTLPGQALSFTVSSPVRPSDVVHFDFHGPANAPVWIFLGKDPASILVPSLSGVLLIDSPAIKFMGVTDSAGELHVTRSSLPPLPAGAEFERTLVQAVYRVPPPPGGRFGPYVIGAASMLLALDQAH
jgi:hypothetical protein